MEGERDIENGGEREEREWGKGENGGIGENGGRGWGMGGGGG